jgi:PKD repeat protein/lysophospholipase L1-like esterase
VAALFCLTAAGASAQTIIPHAGWTLTFVDSQETAGENGAATNAFDGSTATFWHTRWLGASPPPPHEIQINLGAVYNVSGFRYLPRQDGITNGRIGNYEFYVSLDGVNWGTPAATGTLANVATEQQVLFSARTGQYVRLRALSEVNGGPYTSMAELNVLAAGDLPPRGAIASPSSDVTIAPGGSVTFSGTATDPENDTPFTYLWTFGTGGPAPSTQQNPGAVTFANPGVYTVSFTVTDALGNVDPAPPTRTITVGSPGTVISHAGWSLKFVDSQETVGENGAATNAFDGSSSTFWHTRWFGASPPPPHEIQINLGASYSVSGFRYLPRQDGVTTGRIRQYEFYVSTDGVTWGTPVATGTLANVGTEQQIVFTPKAGQYVRLRALSEVNGQPYTSMAELNVLTLSDLPPDGTISSPATDVAIAPGGSVTFSGTGTDPENDLPLSYAWNFGGGGPPPSTQQNPGAVTFQNPGVYVVTFTVADSKGNVDPTPATRTITVGSGGTIIPHAAWTLRFADSQETAGENGAATNAFDGNAGTYWHTRWLGASPPPPHEIQIDLGTTYSISGFRYLPRQDGSTTGRIAQYEFYVSTDGTTWGTPVAAGTLANLATSQQVLFTAKTGRYVRLRALSEVSGQPYTSVAELDVLASGDLPPTGTITAPAGDVTISPGASVSFSGAATDPESDVPFSYAWNFGTGGPPPSTQQNPGAVAFPSPGVYTVTFTVTDAKGNVDPAPPTRRITVQAFVRTIPQTGWTLRFVDSQETVGANEAATNAFDGNPNTDWQTEWLVDEPPPPHEIQIDLGATYVVNGFRYLPKQDSHFGRLTEYEFYVSADGTNWGSPVAAGSFAPTNASTAIDVPFGSKSGRYVRLRVPLQLDGTHTSTIAELNVLQADPSQNQPPVATIVSPVAQNVTLVTGSGLHLAGTGIDPDSNLPLTYRWSVTPGSGVPDLTTPDAGIVHFDHAGTFTVSFTVADALGATATVTRTVTVTGGTSISPSGWALRFVDSQETQAANNGATSAFDGNSSTFWQTQWGTASPPPPPHEIQIDLGASYTLTGFRYLPRQDGSSAGDIGNYEFYVSSDGIAWGTPVAVGTFAADQSEKEIAFPPAIGRFIRLRALSEANGLPYTSVAELQVLQQTCVAPSVRLTRPTSLFLQPATTLVVQADACPSLPGQGVRFAVDGGSGAGGAQIDLFSPPYAATLSNLTMADHVVDAFLIDGAGVPVAGDVSEDRASPVGIGDTYVAIGDGMTLGFGDDDPSDDLSQDGRTTHGEGYPGILADLLTAAKGYPVSIANEGLSGGASADGLAAIPFLLDKYPNAQRFLVMYGHNEFARNVPTGLGLHSGDPGYDGSYKDHLQRIIDAVRAAGRGVVLAKAPPVLPVNGTTDLAIQQYNLVVDELAADPANGITVAPPDFHAFFAAHPELYSDTILMNGSGYRSMAQLWLAALQ